MKLFVLPLLVIGALAVPARKPHLFRGLNRIVGGSEASPGEFPYHVTLMDNSYGFAFHFCSGSIYNKHYIITAGHCVSGDLDNPKNLQIVAGELNLEVVETSEQNVQVSRIFRHEDYNDVTVENDIALLKLVSPLTMNSFVQPIALPESRYTASGNCVVSGWGTTNEGGLSSSNLMKVTVPVISDDMCRTFYGKNDIFDSMICAGYAIGGKDACQGDSGAPLVCKDSNNDRYLAGIVSWGYGCARPRYPRVYTEVSYFVNWIRAKAV